MMRCCRERFTHHHPWCAERTLHDYFFKINRNNMRQTGFTLLEVLVALAIVGTALGASLRAVGSLTQNSSDLRGSVMATWSAENRLAQIRLAHEWPALGQRRVGWTQGEVLLICEDKV